jgi:hypothetical protein
MQPQRACPLQQGSLAPNNHKPYIQIPIQHPNHHFSHTNFATYIIAPQITITHLPNTS